MPLSLESIGSQLNLDANGLITVKNVAVSNRSKSKTPQWFFPATFDNRVNLDVIVTPSSNGFQFAISTGNSCTRVQDYSVDTLQKTIKRVFGIPAGKSETRSQADRIYPIVATFARCREGGVDADIRKVLTSAIQKDMGHGPMVVDSWVMDGAKDDYADFIFVIKGIRNQLPDFDIQLQLAFSPESSSWSVYSQYIRNDDDRIFVDTDEISPDTQDPFDNIRDYLETVVETGNKKYAQYMKDLENDN